MAKVIASCFPVPFPHADIAAAVSLKNADLKKTGGKAQTLSGGQELRRSPRADDENLTIRSPFLEREPCLAAVPKARVSYSIRIQICSPVILHRRSSSLRSRASSSRSASTFGRRGGSAPQAISHPANEPSISKRSLEGFGIQPGNIGHLHGRSVALTRSLGRTVRQVLRTLLFSHSLNTSIF